MNFGDYSQKAHSLAFYPKEMKEYPILGLCGEVGEVAEIIKKVMRDDNGVWNVITLAKLEKELGDVLWYLNEVTVQQNLTLEGIAVQNLFKLNNRIEKGTLRGSGSER